MIDGTCITPTLSRHKPRQKPLDRAAINRMLPLIRQIVSDMRDSYGVLLDQRKTLAALRAEGASQSSQPYKLAKHDVDTTSKRFVDSVQEIEELGGLVRDPERGFVDFLAEGDVAKQSPQFFCWHPDDAEVMFAHPISDSCDDRHHLDHAKSTIDA